MWIAANLSSSAASVMSFQSVSPSSIIASTPSTFTLVTEPVARWRAPISTASMGSLSPGAPVSFVTWSGSSQVCGSAP